MVIEKDSGIERTIYLEKKEKCMIRFLNESTKKRDRKKREKQSVFATKREINKVKRKGYKVKQTSDRQN